MMNRVAFNALLIVSFATVAAAQQAQQQAPPTTAAFVRNAYNGNKNNITRSAEKVGEDLYGLRPGAQEEVRTFGQHLAHVATYNYIWCSQAKGEKNPNDGINLEKTLTTKVEFLKALNDSYSYCDGAYNALTDASGAEIVKITPEGGQEMRLPRMGLLMLNLGHNDEVYGSMVTTMRIKSIVPPASERSR